MFGLESSRIGIGSTKEYRMGVRRVSGCGYIDSYDMAINKATIAGLCRAV
jgi:hypothetical protein